MIISIVAYYITFGVVLFVLFKKKQQFSLLPKLKMTKLGIEFNSNKRHRIYLGDSVCFQVDNRVYIKSKNIVIVDNVNNSYVIKKYLYFTALGQVKILFDCEKIYRYFNIDISSSSFEINTLKRRAMIDIINHNFDYTKSKLCQKYINIIRNILKIKISKDKIVVSQNAYRFSYVLTYRLGQQIKHISVNQKG